MVKPEELRWRVGGETQRVLFAMVEEEESINDFLIGVMDDEHLARHVVNLHNSGLE